MRNRTHRRPLLATVATTALLAGTAPAALAMPIDVGGSSTTVPAEPARVKVVRVQHRRRRDASTRARRLRWRAHAELGALAPSHGGAFVTFRRQALRRRLIAGACASDPCQRARGGPASLAVRKLDWRPLCPLSVS
jgi:hypothetical protein